MTNRLNDAMNKLNVDSTRNSLVRPASTLHGQKLHPGLDSSTISAMFPDAAAAIATEKAKFTQQTGNLTTANRNSNPVTSLSKVTSHDLSDNPAKTWTGGIGPAVAKPDTPAPPHGGPLPAMGQFVNQPCQTVAPVIAGTNGMHNTTLTTLEKSTVDIPLLSPYGTSGTWASMVNTPLVHSFASNGPNNQAEMVANATAMKLAALSTVNNRFALDDVRKYRRARSNDAGANQGPSLTSPGIGHGVPSFGPASMIVNEHGQVFNPALPPNSLLSNPRSRPTSPAIPMQSQQSLLHGQIGGDAFTTSRHHGYLTAYDNSSNLLHAGLGHFGATSGHEDNMSDHSEFRGRSPRGRRGSSRPPDDPTDPSLLQDIPTWLRSLRLHKYTDQLKDLAWDELIELDDVQLSDRGVNALGARRKMLKVFEQVKGQSSFTSRLTPPF
jgi:hypothetical protein